MLFRIIKAETANVKKLPETEVLLFSPTAQNFTRLNRVLNCVAKKLWCSYKVAASYKISMVYKTVAYNQTALSKTFNTPITMDLAKILHFGNSPSCVTFDTNTLYGFAIEFNRLSLIEFKFIVKAVMTKSDEVAIVSIFYVIFQFFNQNTTLHFLAFC